MKRWENVIIFCLGGLLYLIVELLWRGWSHGSMFLVGGACFYAVGSLNRYRPELSVLAQMLVGTSLITVVEFFSGLVINRMLMLHVWDYSAAPLNLFGQICLPFVLLWFPLSGAALFVEDWLRWRLFREPMPQYQWI